jgi:chorismate lyase/3-hydroxybenzoate synthase
VLISGTASIVGHESLHPGDLRAQVNESIDNMEAVTKAAGLPGARLHGLKAYVRHESDASTVASVLAARPDAHALWCAVRADVCRTELLVEFEGVARPEIEAA